MHHDLADCRAAWQLLQAASAPAAHAAPAPAAQATSAPAPDTVQLPPPALVDQQDPPAHTHSPSTATSMDHSNSPADNPPAHTDRPSSHTDGTTVPANMDGRSIDGKSSLHSGPIPADGSAQPLSSGPFQPSSLAAPHYAAATDQVVSHEDLAPAQHGQPDGINMQTDQSAADHFKGEPHRRHPGSSTSHAHAQQQQQQPVQVQRETQVNIGHATYHIAHNAKLW